VEGLELRGASGEIKSYNNCNLDQLQAGKQQAGAIAGC